MNSIARNGRPSCSPMSYTVQMLAWFSAELASASRRKRSQGPRITCQIVRQEFQCDISLEAQILRLVYNPHASATEFLYDAVNATRHYAVPLSSFSI